MAILDSGWGSWDGWSGCLQTCGTDVKKVRYRLCVNPDPKYGGRYCSGYNYEYGLCSPQPSLCRYSLYPCDSLEPGNLLFTPLTLVWCFRQL